MPTEGRLQTPRSDVRLAGAEGEASAARLKRLGPELGAVLVSVRLIIAVVVTLEAFTQGLLEQPALGAVVAGYACYAVWLGLRAIRHGHVAGAPLTLWGDVFWLLLLAWFAAQPSSVFILLLLFPVLFASLGLRLVHGLMVSLLAASGALLVMFQHLGSELSLTDMLLPLSVLVLGPLIAALLRPLVQMREQEALVDHLLDQADSRLGVERVVEMVLRTIQYQYAATRVSLLLRLPGCSPRLFRFDENGLVELKGGHMKTLLELHDRLPDGVASERRLLRFHGGGKLSRCSGFDVNARHRTNSARGVVETLAEQLEADTLAVVPVSRRFPRGCWLTVESAARRYYLRDLDGLIFIIDQTASVIENAVLLEQLCDEAMATERARIGRDLHDTAIQPYLGIKYAIEALALKARPDNALHDDILALQEMVTSELQHLYEVVSTMRSGSAHGDGALATALQRQARRFSELFGIAVTVRCDATLPVSRRMSAAFLQLVSEALTNIRRHTRSTSAEISLAVEDRQFVLKISNDHGDTAEPPSDFIPGSISERAKSLGGRVVVQLRRSGFTDVIIIVPRFAEEGSDDERNHGKSDSSISCR